MFEDERALLVGVALETAGIRPGRQPRLLQLETPVRIMAIAAIHRPFQHLVMKGPVELRLGLVVTSHAELDFTFLQHVPRREVACVGREGPDRLQR